MVKPITVNESYPIVENRLCDKFSATIISPAYCGLHGELSAVLSYTYGDFHYIATGDEKTSELFTGIALAEMHHFKMLGQALLSLGVEPTFTEYPSYASSFYSTRAINYSRLPEKILIDAITMEMVAIDEYEKMLIKLKNEQVRALIERILADERLHLKMLTERFESSEFKIFY